MPPAGSAPPCRGIPTSSVSPEGLGMSTKPKQGPENPEFLWSVRCSRNGAAEGNPPAPVLPQCLAGPSGLAGAGCRHWPRTQLTTNPEPGVPTLGTELRAGAALQHEQALPEQAPAALCSLQTWSISSPPRTDSNVISVISALLNQVDGECKLGGLLLVQPLSSAQPCLVDGAGGPLSLQSSLVLGE